MKQIDVVTKNIILLKNLKERFEPTVNKRGYKLGGTVTTEEMEALTMAFNLLTAEKVKLIAKKNSAS